MFNKKDGESIEISLLPSLKLGASSSMNSNSIDSPSGPNKGHDNLPVQSLTLKRADSTKEPPVPDFSNNLRIDSDFWLCHVF